MATNLFNVGTEYQTLNIEQNHSILDVGYIIPHVDRDSNVTTGDSLELTLMDRFSGDSLTMYLDQAEIKQLILHLQSQLK
jgi:hypothetical protein